MFGLRTKILRSLYKMFPFDLKGDAIISLEADILLSCIIPTYSRIFEIERILSCLAMQDMNTRSFEVIIVEDGSNPEIHEIVRRYSSSMIIKMNSNSQPIRSVGALRNQGLEVSRGKYILFLDDDTLILQRNFLSSLSERFQLMPQIDCIVIPGEADRCLLRHKYDYLTRYSFGAACIAYTRSVLVRIGGFNNMVSYEDIELSIRLNAIGAVVYRQSELVYYHPPFFFTSWVKPISNGLSFLRMYERYSLPVWLLCYINALRFLPFLFFPWGKWKQMGKISGGFFIAPLLRSVDTERKHNPIYK